MGAADIRRVFIDYFKDRDHKLVRSSPVIPRKDKTLAFVNAGMNQVSGLNCLSELSCMMGQWCCSANFDYSDVLAYFN